MIRVQNAVIMKEIKITFMHIIIKEKTYKVTIRLNGEYS